MRPTRLAVPATVLVGSGSLPPRRAGRLLRRAGRRSPATAACRASIDATGPGAAARRARPVRRAEAEPARARRDHRATSDPLGRRRACCWTPAPGSCWSRWAPTGCWRVQRRRRARCAPASPSRSAATPPVRATPPSPRSRRCSPQGMTIRPRSCCAGRPPGRPPPCSCRSPASSTRPTRSSRARLVTA